MSAAAAAAAAAEAARAEAKAELDRAKQREDGLLLQLSCMEEVSDVSRYRLRKSWNPNWKKKKISEKPYRY